MVERSVLYVLFGTLLTLVVLACAPSYFAAREKAPVEVEASETSPALTSVSPVPQESTPTPEPMSVEIPTTLNLAASANGGSVVWATEALEGCPPANLINGSTLDYDEWWSTGPTLPQAIVFSLANDAEYVIDTVALNPFTTEWRYAWAKDFEVYVSTDSTSLEDMGWVGSFTLAHTGVDQMFVFEPVRARYVALVITSHYGSVEGVSLNEFEVYPASPEAEPVEPVYLTQMGNLVAASAGGRIVGYSSEDSSGNYPAEYLNDGVSDSSTGWSSDEDMESLQYVVFSFPGEKPYLVGRVVLNPYSDDYLEDWTKDFEIWGSEVSPDVVDMRLLGSYQLDQIGEDQSFSFEPVVLRYIALVPRSNWGGTEYALNEFEVYQPGDWSSLSPDWAPAAASHTPDDAESMESLDRTLEDPQITFVPGDLSARPVAETALALESIAFDIQVSDLMPYVYHLYGTYFDNLTEISLTNNGAQPVKVWVESSVSNYTDSAVDTVTLAAGETKVVAQNPPLLPTALDLLHDMRKGTVHIEINYLKEGEKRLVHEETTEIFVYSRQDKLLGSPGTYNALYYAATMVTPNDPALDELLRVAADYHPNGSIVWGYGDETDSTNKVWNNLKAIYDAVGDHYDVTYVAVGSPFVNPDDSEAGLYLQRVKLPYEVLESHSGMCIELAQLFASAYEKIFLDPVIVNVPRHAYVAVPISEGSSTYYFVEATMVGWAPFEDAVQVGAEEFTEEHSRPIEMDVLDAYYWLDISELRAEGIWPIPWR
jgi:hypothetical protein